MAEVDEEERADRCENCRFFYPEQDILPGGAGDPDEGECRRRSPTKDICGRSEWPIVFTDEWCGEWESKAVREKMSLSTEIEATNFPLRAKRIIREQLAITTLGELIEYRFADLLELRFLGESSICKVRDCLASYGLKLKGD